MELPDSQLSTEHTLINLAYSDHKGLSDHPFRGICGVVRD